MWQLIIHGSVTSISIDNHFSIPAHQANAKNVELQPFISKKKPHHGDDVVVRRGMETTYAQ